MDKREQIARMAQTKEDEILLARVYERITSAAARNIPAATAFLSKREQMLAAELLRGQDFAFFGGPAMAEREVCCYVPEYLDESWLTGDEGPIAAVARGFFCGRHAHAPGFSRRAHGLRDQAGDGGGYLCLGGQLRFSRHAGDPAVPAAEFSLRWPHEAACGAAPPSTRSASRSRRSRPSAIPSPRCGSTASSPPAFPSAAARPRTISPPENAS